MTNTTHENQNHNRRLMLIGAVLFVIYYVTDCTLDSLIFGEESISEQLFSPSLHEVAIRILSGAFLFAFYFIASILLNKNRHLQADLARKTQQLLVSNRELEAYNYALSHELGTSLTRIVVAKEIMKKKSTKCKASLCSGFLDHINTGCDKLSKQIDSMLLFSEANRSEIDRKPVSIHNMAREIAMEIAAYSKGEALDIQIDNKLETECDPQLVHIALKNLIDNAIKFRSPDRHGEIEIGMENKAGGPIYYIRDNGLGFDPADAERLFRPFERLPNSKHLPGTGVGLATASAIIERHGGKLWAEGAIDNGATFYFTLDSSTAH